MKKSVLILTAALAATAPALPVAADSLQKFSNDLSSFTLQSTALGSQAIEGVANLTVSGVKMVGDGVIILLESADKTIKLSLKGSSHVARDVNLAVGQAITVSSSSAGILLAREDRVLAFLPNQLGAKLTHSGSYGG